MALAYTPVQIAQYESHISLPAQFRKSSNPALNVAYLTSLHIHQLSSIPYENLTLHYSKEHTVSLDPQVLFQKIVSDKRGRGGYCMEGSILFHHVLRALGFTVYMAGVRIRPRIGGVVPGGDYIGWVHIVNIVTLPDNSKYVLDVSFGGDGPTKPLPLISEHVTQNLGSQQVRLLHGTIPQQLDQSQKLWMYQYRNREDQEWNSFYAFPETEFLPADFEVMNFYTSQFTGERNFMTRSVLIVKFLRGEEEEEGIVGKVMLVNGDVKRNDGGKTTVVEVCRTEEQRVKALKEHFGIVLTEEEISGIKGRNVELLAE